MNSAINKFYLIYFYRIFQTRTAAKLISFPSTQGAFSKINRILGYKNFFNTVERIHALQSTFLITVEEVVKAVLSEKIIELNPILEKKMISIKNSFHLKKPERQTEIRKRPKENPPKKKF